MYHSQRGNLSGPRNYKIEDYQSTLAKRRVHRFRHRVIPIHFDGDAYSLHVGSKVNSQSVTQQLEVTSGSIRLKIGNDPKVSTRPGPPTFRRRLGSLLDR